MTIEKIVSNRKLKFINDLYQNSDGIRYSILYDHILFVNVETTIISEFIAHFNKDDLSVKHGG